MNTISKELTRAKEDLELWTAEIVGDNVSIFSMNKFANAHGTLSALKVMTRCHDHEQRQEEAKHWISEAQRKSCTPGAGTVFYAAEIRVFERVLSGDITFD